MARVAAEMVPVMSENSTNRSSGSATKTAGKPSQPLSWDLPPGKTKHDPNFGRDLEVYHGDVSGGLSLPSGAQGDAILTVGY